MLKTLMYSYKGGAGRTVSTANIAALLAKEFNKTVVCIDLDVESAGLAVVFGVSRSLDAKGRYCMQDVLNRPAFRSAKEFEEWWPNLHFDIGSEYGIPEGKLTFIPSRAATFESVRWEGRAYESAGQPLDDLLTRLRQLIRPDFILIDSASGLSDAASVGLANSSCMVTFFRMNRQFLEGTIIAVEFVVNRLENVEKIILVPTAVPAIADGESHFQEILNNNKLRLTSTLRIGKEDKVELLEPIRESNWLKWEERILPFEEKLSQEDLETLGGYRGIASRLVNVERERGGNRNADR
jgi:MinD-like ATPase involved in chromosome partitioning or flagellar assembly